MALYRKDLVEKYRSLPLGDELNERAMTGIAYWLNASPMERTEEDGMIVAHFARLAYERMCEQETALREAERFMAYFAGETGNMFVGPGTPKSCLEMIRKALAA